MSAESESAIGTENTLLSCLGTAPRVELGSEGDGAGVKPAGELVEELMGRRPELRFAFIQANARLVEELDV